MVELALDFGDSSSLDFLIEHDGPLPFSLLQPFLRFLLAQFLEDCFLLLHDCALGLYLHLFELSFDLVMEVIEWGRWKEGDTCCIILFMLGEVQGILLSIQLDYADPFVSLLLRDSIGGLSLNLQLLLQRKLLDLLRFGVQEFLCEA